MFERISSYPKLKKRQAVQQLMINKSRVKGSGFENFSFMHGLLHFGLRFLKPEKKGAG